ncbi:MAG: hypothetical protein R6W91_00205 [Thermoplasmata archaeon]
MQECVYEHCQLFVNWQGNKQCSFYWMGMNALVDFNVKEKKENTKSISEVNNMPGEKMEKKYEKNLELGDYGTFVITEHGKKESKMNYFLQKTSLVLEDEEGNKIWIDKRDGCIKIKRRPNLDESVNWHREND